MVKKRLKLIKRKAKDVKDLVPAALTEKAAELNPLAPNVPEVPSLADVPRITTENIGEHREKVLKGARKYISPLAHSKRTSSRLISPAPTTSSC
jgi:hypothetical protein